LNFENNLIVTLSPDLKRKVTSYLRPESNSNFYLVNGKNDSGIIKGLGKEMQYSPKTETPEMGHFSSL